ncbi:MAG TPA: NADH-quinone oxidoreductase subunit J, partial [Acidobacteriota bacterium]|nr:NADH-quinone oxidoreductase subunit J [Acidobacteriota bacterium]
MALIIFIVLSVLCVGAVAAMIVSRNQAHNALFLVLAFASLGGIFGLLDAPFAAAVQVLVYAGAIMVLFLFAIMMFNLRRPEPPERKRFRAILGAALGLILLAELILAGRRALGGLGTGAVPPGRDIAHL